MTHDVTRATMKLRPPCAAKRCGLLERVVRTNGAQASAFLVLSLTMSGIRYRIRAASVCSNTTFPFGMADA